ncbi:hypothetical protein B0J11DRAFT_136027 [Dendryphion nanum]|uniref:Secreted protein n=1 Tax=Dendryphion nanum TaxID=256645 RepID=A0A9P9IAP5_9PLEO|nr:hypothetical protein B0J11DRAFT_136027 [Dendryphion nanum]
MKTPNFPYLTSRSAMMILFLTVFQLVHPTLYENQHVHIISLTRSLANTKCGGPEMTLCRIVRISPSSKTHNRRNSKIRRNNGPPPTNQS